MEIIWTDIYDIAIALDSKHPNTDPISVSFPNLRQMVLELDGFVGKKDGCNERILEAIQMAWLDEK